jgi:hypothetical protein
MSDPYSIYCSTKRDIGFRNDVLAHPGGTASYAVPV